MAARVAAGGVATCTTPAQPPLCSATVAVADVAALDAESFYEDHVSSSLPLLIRDEQLHTLRGRWTDEYLSELAGAQMHAEVRLSAGNASNSFPLVKVAGERTEPQRVAEFLALYRRPDRTMNVYATNLVIDALRHELPRPPFTALLDHGCVSGWCGGLWLGAGGQRSALHRDFAENVHLVVQGAKRFVLFAPNESRGLFPRPEPSNWLGHASRLPDGARTCGGSGGGGGGGGGGSGGGSGGGGGESGDRQEGDAACPAEFASFGTVRRRALECTVRAGEMLYLPSAWWHEVTSEGDAGRSLSLNFWFRAEWPRGTLRHLTAEAAALRPPLRASAYRQLGTELAQRGRGPEAMALLRVAAELEPRDADAAAMLATLERQFGGAGPARQRGRVRM